MYLLELTFLKVETEARIREKALFANNERKVRTFETSWKICHLFQQIHQREKTWKMMVYSSPLILLLAGFGLLFMPHCSLINACARNIQNWSQSLNHSLLFFLFFLFFFYPPLKKCPCFPLKCECICMGRRKQVYQQLSEDSSSPPPSSCQSINSS